MLGTCSWQQPMWCASQMMAHGRMRWLHARKLCVTCTSKLCLCTMVVAVACLRRMGFGNRVGSLSSRVCLSRPAPSGWFLVCPRGVGGEGGGEAWRSL